MKYYGLSLVFVMALFLIPLLAVSAKKKLFTKFDISSLVKVFNWSFVVELTITFLFLVSDYFVTKTSYEFGTGDDLRDLYLGTFYGYIVTGIFVYVPLIAILNIANMIKMKRKKVS